MVKIALDTENYDIFIGTVRNLDLRIKAHEKKLDNPGALLPKNTGWLKFLFSKDETILLNTLSRNDIYQLKQRLFLCKFSSEKIRKVGRPKKRNNESEAGRPYGIIKKSCDYYEELNYLAKIMFFSELLLGINGIPDDKMYEIIKIPLKNKNYKQDIYDYNKLNQDQFTGKTYIVLQRKEKEMVLFRFKNILLNNALIIRINKIIDLFNIHNIVIYANVLKIKEIYVNLY